MIEQTIACAARRWHGTDLRLRISLRTATALLLALSVLLPRPAFADRGTEWEPGGILYKFTYRYEQNQKPQKPRITSTNLGGISADDDDNDAQPARRNTKKRTRAQQAAVKSNTVKKSADENSKQRSTAKRQRPVRIASLGGNVGYPTEQKQPQRSITGGGGITWVASARCLNGRLKSAIHHVARTYGRVRVSSTCRTRSRNRRVGGARTSYHLTGNAADFRVFGNVRGAARYLRSLAGGYKHYGGGLFHIDTGPRRSW
jgi:hypothetical protein